MRSLARSGTLHAMSDDRWSDVELTDATERLSMAHAEHAKALAVAEESVGRLAAYERAIAGRFEAPTPDEVSAHCAAGGFWMFREFQPGEPYHAPVISGDAEMVMISVERAAHGMGHRWWKLDSEARVVDW